MLSKTQTDTAGVKVPDELKEQFEDLLVDDLTLRAKFVNFSRIVHEEQKVLVVRSKEIWAEAIFVMGLEGEWSYRDGKVYPVDGEAAK